MGRDENIHLLLREYIHVFRFFLFLLISGENVPLRVVKKGGGGSSWDSQVFDNFFGN